MVINVLRSNCALSEISYDEDMMSVQLRATIGPSSQEQIIWAAKTSFNASLSKTFVRVRSVA